MAAERAFYITQGSLTVWWRGALSPGEGLVFADSDSGLRDFDEFLETSDSVVSFVLADVIEEEFAQDRMPRLGFRDRKLLLERRVQGKFPRSHYRLPVHHGRESKSSADDIVVHSAISNEELLDPWLQIMLRHEVPLTGIFSVPLIASSLLACYGRENGPVMLLTQHQQRKLRQVFLRHSRVLSSRLSQSPAVDDDEYPHFVITELNRSRHYLERTRLLSNIEPLAAYIVAQKPLAERIIACATSDSPLQIHIIDPDELAKRIGQVRGAPADRQEMLYLALPFRRQPRHSYAVSGETRFWRMRQMRHALIGTALAVATACGGLSGLYLADAWSLNERRQEIDDQVARLTETFRRENEQFDPIRAGSHEMKLAVDTGDFILANRLPVPWVMQQLGLVMGNYPDIRIQTLAWSTESAASDAPPARRGEQVMPVPVAALVAVNASIVAQIEPFDGDMRKAFERIDALAAELRTRTAFSQVAVVEYPIDARPQSSIAGEIVDAANADAAQFQLNLSLPINVKMPAGSEVSHDPV